MSMAEAIEQAATRTRKEPEPWDYINPDDDLLYCGICHQPKERRLEWPKGHPQLIGIPCGCHEQKRRM